MRIILSLSNSQNFAIVSIFGNLLIVDSLTGVYKATPKKVSERGEVDRPEIRFPEFNDAWEQRKLGDVSIKVTEKNVALEVTEAFTNSAEYGVVSQRDFFDKDIARAESIGGYYIVRCEDFVYNPRISTLASVGPINRNKLGRAGVMSPIYTVFRINDDVENTFLEQYFKSCHWHAFMKLNGDSGARSDRFSIKDSVFFEMPIPLPHHNEQQAIGAFLCNLDNLIALHQREPRALFSVTTSV